LGSSLRPQLHASLVDARIQALGNTEDFAISCKLTRPVGLTNPMPQTGKTDVKTYDLGIVFVHGIGQQKRGESLVQMIDALVECTALLRYPTNTCIPEGELIDLRLESGGPNAEASLRFRPAGGSEQIWLLSEARWAESFPEPTYGEVAIWAGQILPRTLLVHFFKSLARRREQTFRVLLAVMNGAPVGSEQGHTPVGVAMPKTLTLPQSAVSCASNENNDQLGSDD
jgi:hypothetical protein